MNIAEYWNEKTTLLENAFEGWQRKEEIQVRKLVIAKVMDIPAERIAYYLKRDMWYLKFSLGDDAEVDRAFAEEESTKEKVQAIVKEFFYKKDQKSLCEIKERVIAKGVVFKEKRKSKKKGEEEKSEREKLCDCIKELVEDKIYKKLDGSDKSLLDTLEKIYFEPIELFNGYAEEAAGSENYYSMLVEQWKTANDMAANISAQRNNMNNFYMSLMSILIGGILFSNQVLDANLVARTVLYGAILIIGAVCCNKWIAQIDNYGRLNGAKYDVINAIERNLPANVMLYEWLHTEQNARRNKVKISFSKQEKDIAKLFRIVVISVPALLLISAWGEFIWTLIQK